MKTRTRRVVGIAGGLLLLFGLLCLNYTKMDNVEKHVRVAQERGWPAPSAGIGLLGMLFAPLGGGLIGFIVKRGPGCKSEPSPSA